MPAMVRIPLAISAVILLLSGPWLLGQAAHAQDNPVGAPIQLTPSKPPALQQPAPQAPAAASDILVERLADIDGEAIGLLGPAQGGLGANMWVGTGRDLVERLLPRLPATSIFPTARKLTRRLLLTAATPPAGSAKASLIALRSERLMAMGDIAAAGALVDASPDRQSNADLTRINVERRLLEGDVAGACNLAGRVGETSVYWQRIRIFCHAIAGQADFATLGIELLREQDVDDPAFFALTAELNGAAAGDLAPSPATPLTFALLMATQTPIPDWFIATAGPAVLAGLATAPNVDLRARLQAGERAEQAGALPAAQLAELYRGLNLTAEQVAAALTASGDQSGVTPLAAAYLAAHEYTIPSARAEALRVAWDGARARGEYPVMARLSVDLLAEIAPATSLAWFAADAARASLMTGNRDRALTWYRLVRSESAFDAQSATTEALAWPLLRLAFGDREAGLLAWQESRIDAWLAARHQEFPQTADDDAALLLALLDAQAESIAPGRWADLMARSDARRGALTDPALWFALNDAAFSGHLGETVLLALIALGDASALHQQGLVLNRVILSLHQVGLAGEARALAVEAAILAGL